MSIRAATHAGSWYSNSASVLSSQLESWLDTVGIPTHSPAKAIISPHAGYRYSGPTAAYAYRQIDPTVTNRVFILGPSHVASLPGCALSSCSHYDTPLGSLALDQEVIAELRASGLFQEMSQTTEEEEHSLELQLPFLAKVMEGHAVTIVPILVGALNPPAERKFGALLAKYLKDPGTVWIISSDFCHWGRRFHYTYQYSHDTTIHESIKRLDEEGMKAVQSLDPITYSAYQEQYSNTICGRHPIAVLLNALAELQGVFRGQMDFVHYEQSSKCLTKQDSSVSYAAGVYRLI